MNEALASSATCGGRSCHRAGERAREQCEQAGEADGESALPSLQQLPTARPSQLAPAAPPPTHVVHSPSRPLNRYCRPQTAFELPVQADESLFRSAFVCWQDASQRRHRRGRLSVRLLFNDLGPSHRHGTRFLPRTTNLNMLLLWLSLPADMHFASREALLPIPDQAGGQLVARTPGHPYRSDLRFFMPFRYLASVLFPRTDTSRTLCALGRQRPFPRTRVPRAPSRRPRGATPLAFRKRSRCPTSRPCSWETAAVGARTSRRSSQIRPSRRWILNSKRSG